MTKDTARPRRNAQAAEHSAVVSARAPAAALLAIGGMGCPNCVGRVQNALTTLRGVEAAQVSLAPPIAYVWYDGARVSEKDLTAAVDGAGVGTTHVYRAEVLL